MSTLSKLSQRSLDVLANLASSDGKGKSAAEIALEMDIERVTVSSTITRLRAKKLVECTQPRCVTLGIKQLHAITDAGREELKLKGRPEKALVEKRHGGAYSKAENVGYLRTIGSIADPREKPQQYKPPQMSVSRADADQHVKYASRGTPC